MFKKKWHRIPVGILTAVMLVCLLAGSAFAAYGWLNFTTTIEVMEPLSIEYNLAGEYGGDDVWHPLGDADSLTISGHAGNYYDIQLRIHNASRSALTVKTTFTGDTAQITCIGFPDGLVDADHEVDGEWEWEGVAQVKINNDAPAPETYTITPTFTRE